MRKKRLFTAKEVATYLGLTVSTVRVKMSKHAFPDDCIVRINPRNVRFDIRAIDAWIDSKKSKGASNYAKVK